MNITKWPHHFLLLLHRLLLRVTLYKKCVIWLGLDSYRYKKYYKTLHLTTNGSITAGEVDGYQEESGFDNIIKLVDQLAQYIPAPASVLDIGCGTGRYLKQMSRVWPQAHLEGIDISAEIVDKFTRVQVPGVPIHVLDIEVDERFHVEHRGEFTLICMMAIIQIIAQAKIHALLNKVFTLCHEGGYFYVQFNVETAEKKSSVGYKRYSIEELAGLLVDHGFVVVQSGRTDILKDYATIIAQKPGSE